LFQLDLHEANKKLANGAARAGEETTALKMQLEEQKKQLEDQRRKLEEHKKGLDSKSRQLEEKEKSIADVDQKLEKRKEKLDQLEAQIQKVNVMKSYRRGIFKCEGLHKWRPKVLLLYFIRIFVVCVYVPIK